MVPDRPIKQARDKVTYWAVLDSYNFIWLGQRISQRGRVVNQRQMPPAEATRTASGCPALPHNDSVALSVFVAILDLTLTNSEIEKKRLWNVSFSRVDTNGFWDEMHCTNNVKNYACQIPAGNEGVIRTSQSVFDQNSSVQPVCEEGWTMVENLCFR